MKNIYFIIIALFLLLYIIYVVKKDRLSIKESFWWVMCSIVTLVLAIFPKSIDEVAKCIGVSYPPTLILVFSIVFLLFMIFRASTKISEQNEKIMDLTQELSIIKGKMNKNESK